MQETTRLMRRRGEISKDRKGKTEGGGGRGGRCGGSRSRKEKQEKGGERRAMIS
jgi:hypothetical protein